MRKIVFLIIFGSLLLDQLTKLIIIDNFKLYESYTIINNFFRFTYVQNTGAAFSIFSNQIHFLSLVSFGALLYLIYYVVHKKTFRKIEVLYLGIIGGGIIGNLIDRLRFGFVVDFLDFNFGNYNFPVFNISDICLVIGTILLIVFHKEEKKND